MDSLNTVVVTYTKKDGSLGVFIVTNEADDLMPDIRNFLTKNGVSDINLNSNGQLVPGKTKFQYISGRFPNVTNVL